MRTIDNMAAGRRAGRARRWTSLAVLAVAAGGALALGTVPAHADQVNLAVEGNSTAGLLETLKFDRPEVTAMAGDTITVTNETTGLLKSQGVTVEIANQRQVVKDQPVTFTIPRTADDKTYTATARGAAIGLNTKATVTAKGAPAPVAPAPSNPQQPAPPPVAGQPGAGQPPAVAPPTVGAPPPVVGGAVPALPPNFGGVPVARQQQLGSQAPLPPGVSGGTAGGTAQTQGTDTPPAVAAGQPAPEAAGSTMSNGADSSGYLTLLVLVAAVVIAGVGSAAVRAALMSRLRPAAV